MNSYQDLGKLHFIHRLFNAFLYLTMSVWVITAETYVQGAAIAALASFGVSTGIIGRVFYFDHARKVHMSNWFVGDPTVPKNYEEPALQAAIKASKRFRTLVPLALFTGTTWIYFSFHESLVALAIVGSMQMLFICAAIPYILYSRDEAVAKLVDLSNDVTLIYV